MTTARDTILGVLVRRQDSAFTATELCTTTRLSRGTVASELAGLAVEGRAMRMLAEQDGMLTVRWRWRKPEAPRPVAAPEPVEEETAA